LSAALAVGLGGLLSGDLHPPRAGNSAPQATQRAPQDKDGTQAASSVPQLDDEAARMAAAQNLLSARAAAVKARSKSAWMATVDLNGSAFRGRQSVAFDNLIRLPLGQFSYGTVQLAPTLASERAEQVGHGLPRSPGPTRWPGLTGRRDPLMRHTPWCNAPAAGVSPMTPTVPRRCSCGTCQE